MTPESRYKIAITVVMTEEGKNEAPMMEASLVYNGLPYPQALMVEKGLIDFEAGLNAAGAQAFAGAGGQPK